MIRQVFLTLLSLCCASVLFAARTDSGKQLDRLWSSYRKAEKSDLPRDMERILLEIKDISQSSEDAASFYKAACLYVDVCSSRNWKQRDSLKKELDAEVESFGNALMSFRHKWPYPYSEAAFEYILGNSEALKGSLTRGLYPDLAEGLADNDLEYAIWACVKAGNKTALSRRDLVLMMGSGEMKRLALQLELILHQEDTYSLKERLEEFLSACSDPLVSLLAQEQILKLDFYALERKEEKDEQEYLSLRQEIKQLLGRAAGLVKKGKTPSLSGEAEGILRQMEEKEIRAIVKNDTLKVFLRNLQGVKIEIGKDGEKALQKSLKKEHNKFYIPDTLSLDLSSLSDSDWEIKLKSEKLSSSLSYPRRSLSFALRRDSDAVRAYAADYHSGQGLDRFDLVVCDYEGKTLGVYPIIGKGFVEIGREAERLLSNRGNWARAEYREHEGEDVLMSNQCRLPFSYPDAGQQGRTAFQARILTDRGAYRMGETLHYKAIIYSGLQIQRPAAEGFQVCVSLISPKGETVLTDSLSCSSTGSVQSDFSLENLSLNGDYSLCVEAQGRRIASCRVRIDESTLPDFDMIWEEAARMLLPGESIVASGQINCFSGRSPKDYRVEISLLQAGEQLGKASIRSDQQGRFSYSFPAPKEQNQQRFYWRYYLLQATVTAPDGQTQSFTKSICIRPGLEMNLKIDNALKGEVRLQGSERAVCVKDNFLRVSFFDPSQKLRSSLRVEYSLRKGSRVLSSGKSDGKDCEIDVRALEDGIYTLKAEAAAIAETGKRYTRADSCKVLIIKESKTLPEEVEFWYCEKEASEAGIAFGSGSDSLWACVALHSEGNRLLKSRYLSLGKGEIAFQDFEEDLPELKEGLSISLFFFRDASMHQYTKKIEIPLERQGLNLRFTRTTDLTSPGQNCTFSVIADRDCELAVSVFDKASEKLMQNVWNPIPQLSRSYPAVGVSSACGSHDSAFSRDLVRPVLTSGKMYYAKSATAEPTLESNSDAALEQEILDSSLDSDEEEETPQVRVREDFSTTLFWAPAMTLHKEQPKEWSFSSSDRLSTFAVQLFAHDSDMNSVSLREEMRVSIPVELSISKPAYLYSSDTWNITIALTNNSDAVLQGNLSLKFTDQGSGGGKTLLSKVKKRIVIKAGESVSINFESRVPDCKLLGVSASFSPSSRKEGQNFGSDAVFFTVDVREPVRIITESHSALISESELQPGQLDSLRSAFSAVDASGADLSYISISEMLSRAIPQSIEHRSDNCLDLCKELFARVLLTGEAVGQSDKTAHKLLSCRNPDGGFAWFAGMDSSQAMTALVLEVFFAFRDSLSPELEAAIEPCLRYLDRQFLLEKHISTWRGRLSLGQYLYVRSMYPEVAFDSECSKTLDKKEWKQMVEDYLLPRSEDILQGRILEKARRLLTLSRLGELSSRRLASELGVSQSRLEKAERRDLESLVQYAVYNGQGEYYYPNAIVQRALLESELYAHCLLCDLLDRKGRKDISEGIRMHLMLQKETQHWEDDFACLLALQTISKAEKKTLERKVAILSARDTLPLGEVKAYGNGFRLECAYYKEGKRIEKGEALKVGDRIRAEYHIYSDRSRSFVRFTAPRSSCLECVDGKSGFCYPYSYREVKADRTEYWAELWPEHNTVLTEELLVVRAGKFSSEGLAIESVYAPHYRAGIPSEYQMISMPSDTTQP